MLDTNSLCRLMPTKYDNRKVKLLENAVLGNVKSKCDYVYNLRMCKVMDLYYLDSSSKEENCSRN